MVRPPRPAAVVAQPTPRRPRRGSTDRIRRGDDRRMTDSVPARPPTPDEPGPTVLLGDVTASSVAAWSVLGELRPPVTGAGGSRPSGRTPPPPPAPIPVEPVPERTPGPVARTPGPQARPTAPGSRRPESRRPESRRPESREQGQQREKLAQRDRQVVAQLARDEDTLRRQARPGSTPPARPVRGVVPPPARSGPRTPAVGPARQTQSAVRWTAQPTARGAPQRSTATGPGPRTTPGTGPRARPRDGRDASARTGRSRSSPVRIVGLVVVVLVLAGRCLNGLT